MLAVGATLGPFVSCTQARSQCENAQDCFEGEQCINSRCEVPITFEPTPPAIGPIEGSAAQASLSSFALLSGAKRGLTLLGKTNDNSFVTWSWSGFEWELKKIREELELYQLEAANYYIGPDDRLHITYVDKALTLKHLYTVPQPDGSDRWMEEDIATARSEQELILAVDADFDSNGDMYICAYRGDIIKTFQANGSLELIIYSDKGGAWSKVLEDQGEHGFYCNIKVRQGIISLYELASRTQTPKMLTAQWAAGITMPEFSTSVLEGYPVNGQALFENKEGEQLLLHSLNFRGGAINLSYKNEDRWHTERLYKPTPTRAVTDLIALPHPDQRDAVTLFLYESNHDGTSPKFIRVDKRGDKLNAQEELLNDAQPQNLSAVMDRAGLIHIIYQGNDQRLHYQVKP